MFDVLRRIDGLTIFGFYDELILLSLFLLGSSLIKKEFALFSIITLMSCLLSNFNLIQYLLDFKYIAALIFFGYFYKNLNYYFYNKLFKTLVIMNSIFVCWEYLSPNTYQSLFIGDYNAGFGFGDSSLYRANGFFIHPGELAFFSCMMLLWFGRDFYSCLHAKLYFTISILLLALTFQRAELFGIVFVVLLSIFFTKKITHKILFLKSTLLFIYLVFLTFAFLIKPEIYLADEARTVLYKGAFQILNENYFFGLGPGSYGSFYSINNFMAYDILDFERYWWFQQGRYITDTFWPKIFAEYGSLGFIVWSIIIFSFFNYKKTSLSFIISIFLIIVSLQSPIFFNVKLILIALVVAHVEKSSVNKSF